VKLAMARRCERGGVGDAVNRANRRLSRYPPVVRAASLLRNQCNLMIGYHLALGPGCGENGEAWLLDRVARRVHRFIDIGANRGDWSAALLARNRTAVGIAVEPGEVALAQLRSRALPGLSIVAAAAGDESGTAAFYEEPEAGETSSATGHHTIDARRREVAVVTVPELLTLSGWDRLEMLKVDAEGWDFKVLAGATADLAEQRISLVQFEYGPAWVDAGCTLKAALDYLDSHGYAVFALTRGGAVRFDYGQFGEFFGYSNFVAVSEAARSWIGG
jgi:FkbM family methyltransferase